jgi:hypothetical protein
MAEDLLPKLTIKSGLDPRFDWNESLDENHIFEEERQVRSFLAAGPHQ